MRHLLRSVYLKNVRFTNADGSHKNAACVWSTNKTINPVPQHFILSKLASRCMPHWEGRGNLVLRHYVAPIPLIFSRHCGLSGGTQRRPWCQSKEIKILINNHLFSRVRIEPTTVTLQSHLCALAPRRPQKSSFLKFADYSYEYYER